MQQAIKQNIDANRDYLNKLHGKSKGWITRAEINPSYRQWHYKFLELIQQDLSGDNVYISLNTFYSTFRRLEYIKELNAHFIDLDMYKTKFTKEQILMHLDAEYFDQSIPRPNYIIDSGRGLYLIWLINAVPNKALPLWKAVEEYLYNELKPFGADRQALDPTRILRVPGSINSKSNTKVEVLEQYSYIYDLREIQSEYLPDLTPTTEKKRGRPKKVIYVYRERSLYYSRIQDIIKLCELREYDLDGKRELILFLYRYWSCCYIEDTQKALEDTLSLNSEFVYPLAVNEVIRATRSAEKVFNDNVKEYKYKNDTLINLLEITEQEECYMLTIISKGEYKRRKNIRDRVYQKENYDSMKEKEKYNSAKAKAKYKEKLKSTGALTKKEQLEELRQKIKALKKQGFKNKDISQELDLPIKTLERHITFMKKNGLL